MPITIPNPLPVPTPLLAATRSKGVPPDLINAINKQLSLYWPVSPYSPGGVRQYTLLGAEVEYVYDVMHLYQNTGWRVFHQPSNTSIILSFSPNE